MSDWLCSQCGEWHSDHSKQKAAEQQRTEPEPVAWRWRSRGSSWHLTEIKPDLPFDGIEEEPLYTHPSEASE